MIYIKLHKGSSVVLAVCDEELIGKTFEEGELRLEVNENFYKGEKKTKEEVIKLMKNIKCVNAAGKESVAAAIEAKIISKKNILIINGVPHAQSLVL